MAFFEYSGSQDIDDPLHDFSAYVIDPTMWDSTELNEPRTIYRTHAGFQTRQRFLNGPTVLRFGFEAQMDHAQVYSIPGSGGDQWISEQHQNLIDVVYAPYLAMESQPLSWVRLAGNLRMNFLAHDVQDVCPKTCSLEPKGQGTHMVPIFKGGLIFGPWLNTQFFINLGKGFYRLDEVNPVGSAAEQQINRPVFAELGFLTNPGGSIEIQGSLWGTRNDTDFSYNLENEEFVNQGSSHRYGVKLEGRMWLPHSTTFRGELTVSRSTFRQTQQAIPLMPQLVGYAAFHKDWNTNWSTSLQWQYIGERTTGNQSFRAFQTMDFLVQYHIPVTADTEDWTVSLGIVNVGNHKSPFNLFHFDSGFTPDRPPALDVNFFPGQPRTVVAGISFFY
ncbi:MAG TPA: hypothetical protein PKK23_17430 [Nitrospirales bacterium]|nr:hypothetical protein [Nitrospirales bacterium]